MDKNIINVGTPQNWLAFMCAETCFLYWLTCVLYTAAEGIAYCVFKGI